MELRVKAVNVTDENAKIQYCDQKGHQSPCRGKYERQGTNLSNEIGSQEIRIIFPVLSSEDLGISNLGCRRRTGAEVNEDKSEDSLVLSHPSCPDECSDE